MSAPSHLRRSSGSDALPVPRACANCGVTLGGAYCAGCGQRDGPAHPTLRDLAEEAWDTFVSVDGKLVHSIRLLTLCPGELTVRYLAGQRARFISPIRLYLACSVTFFLLEALLPERVRMVQIHASGVSGIREPLSTNDAVAGVTGPEWSRRIQRGIRRAAYAQQAGFAERMSDHAPQVAFVLVPLQAVLLAGVYRRRRRTLPAHLVFSLHTHAAAFAAFAGAGALAAVVPEAARVWVGVAAIVALLAYLPISMRRVYGGRWSATLARTSIVGGVYMVGLLLALVVLTVGTYYAMGVPAR